MLAVRNLEEENKYVFFATRNGTGEKIRVARVHARHARNGINAINIEEGDELVAARITDGNQIVFLASHEGMAVRFDENHVRPMGRNAYGVRGIDLDEKRLRCRHGHNSPNLAQAQPVGRPGATEARSRCRTSRTGEVVDLTQKGIADPFRHRKRLRQAHRRRRISPDQPRRQRRHQRQDHRARRQSRRHRAGRRKLTK